MSQREVLGVLLGLRADYDDHNFYACSEIARKAGLQISSVSRSLHAMAKTGLVEYIVERRSLWTQGVVKWRAKLS